MSIESRITKLEAAMQQQPSPSRERMQAFIDAVRRNEQAVHLIRQAVAAEQLGNADTAAVYHRKADELVYSIALQYFDPEVAAKYAPAAAPEDTNPDPTPAEGDESRGNGQ